MSRPTFSERAQREAALAALLQELFTVEELSRLVVHEFGDQVHASVAWDRPRATVVYDVARRLSQRGRVPQLLDALPHARPFRRADIESVAARWSAAPASAHPPEDRRVTRSRWAAGALLLSVAAAGAVATVWTTAPHEPAQNVAPLDPSPAPAPATQDEPASRPASRSSGDRSDCCRQCGATSKVCGNSCISLNMECHQGPGCACS